MSHECSQVGFLGEIREFISNSKGLRLQMSGLVLAIFLQIATFAFLYGKLTNTVDRNSDDITRILAKFDNVRIVGVAVAGEQGIQGIQGERGH